jgi:hypothetical protein
MRRSWLRVAATNYLPWLPAAFAARLRAGGTPELFPLMQPSSVGCALAAGLPGSIAQGIAACVGGRDARGRFARAPLPVLRGRQAELAQAHAEVAALAPWKAAVARARKAKRLMRAQARAARVAKIGRDVGRGLPAGASADGGTTAGVRVSQAVVDAGPSPGMTGGGDGAGPATAEYACGDRGLLQRGAVGLA